MIFHFREADIKPAETPTAQFKRFKKNVSSSGLSYDNDINAEQAFNKRIRIYDIIRVPTYARVWEVASMGEVAAAGCQDFLRHEWNCINKSTLRGTAEPYLKAAESSDSLYSQSL